MHTCTHMHTHTMHTCTCTHMHTHNAYMHTQGERRLIGLQDCWGRGRGGLIFSQNESGGGVPRNQASNKDTHMHIHTYTRIHTHNAHINRHAHVCMSVSFIMCVYVCIHIHTYTEILLDSKYTLREVRFFCNWNYSKVLYSFPQRVFTFVIYKYVRSC